MPLTLTRGGNSPTDCAPAGVVTVRMNASAPTDKDTPVAEGAALITYEERPSGERHYFELTTVPGELPILRYRARLPRARDEQTVGISGAPRTGRV